MLSATPNTHPTEEASIDKLAPTLGTEKAADMVVVGGDLDAGNDWI